MQRVRAVRAALALWRGRPLADVAGWPVARRAGRAAGRSAVAAGDRALVDARLALGEHAAARAGAGAARRRAPVRRADPRPADARAVPGRPAGRRARGVPAAAPHPAPTISASTRAGAARPARRDPARRTRLSTRRRPIAVPAPADAAASVPAQLPPAVPALRRPRARTRRLDALLAGLGRGRPAAVVISAISGTAGVGKTALAVHWAHRVADRFPDGQLYVNLRGFDPAGAVDRPGRGGPRVPRRARRAAASGSRPSLEAQAGAVPQPAGRPAGAGRAGQRPRRRAGPPAAARLARLPGRGDQPQPAHRAGRRRGRPPARRSTCCPPRRRGSCWPAGSARTGSRPSRTAVDEIIAACARLPLALAIVAARAATHPGFPLAALAGELRDAGGGLDAFDGGDPATDVRAVFSWSYQALSRAPPRLFRLLGLHPGPDIAPPPRPASPACRPAQVRRAAGRAGPGAPGRPSTRRAGTRFHDLLRAYAAELAARRRRRRRPARARCTGCSTTTCTPRTPPRCCCTRSADPITPGRAAAGVAPRGPRRPTGRRWPGSPPSTPVLLAAVGQAAGTGFDAHAWQLAWTLWTSSTGGATGTTWSPRQQRALDAARRLGRPARRRAPIAHRGSAAPTPGWAATTTPHAHLPAGPRPVRRARRPGRPGPHPPQPRLAAASSRAATARRSATPSRRWTLYRAAGDRRGEASALNGVGWCHARLGDYQQALAYCRQALALHRRRSATATARRTLGQPRLRAPPPRRARRRAIADYEGALRLFPPGRGPLRRGPGVLGHIGDAQTTPAGAARRRPGPAWRESWRSSRTRSSGRGPGAGQARRAALSGPAQHRVSSVPAPVPSFGDNVAGPRRGHAAARGRSSMSPIHRSTHLGPGSCCWPRPSP